MLNITFEFIGGPYDGELLHGTLGMPSDAERYYLFSNRGAVGQQFRVASAYAVEALAREQLKTKRRQHFQKHFYVIADRIEDAGDVWVRAEYVYQQSAAPKTSSACEAPPLHE